MHLCCFLIFFPDCWSLLCYNIELHRLIVFVFIIIETYYKIKVLGEVCIPVYVHEGKQGYVHVFCMSEKVGYTR